MPETVTRYVATFVNREGLRTLMTSARGSHTFQSEADAQRWIDAVRANNSPSTLKSVYGETDTFEVRPCECWANHLDPVGVYFD